MSPLSLAVVLLTCAVAGGAVGFFYGISSRCDSCFESGKRAGIAECEQQTEDLKVQLADVSSVGLKLSEDVKDRDAQIAELHAKVWDITKAAMADQIEVSQSLIAKWQKDSDRAKDLETVVAKCRQVIDEKCALIEKLRCQLASAESVSLNQIDSANAAARKAQDGARELTEDLAETRRKRDEIRYQALGLQDEIGQLRRVVATVARVVNDSIPAESLGLANLDSGLHRAYFDDATQVADLG